MSTSVIPHRYTTRLQVKQSRAEYLKKMSHLNLLYTISQTTDDEERIGALTEVYRFLQEFQPWKHSARLRNLIEKQICRLLNEIPIEIEHLSAASKSLQTDGLLFDLFELENVVLRLENIMKM